MLRGKSFLQDAYKTHLCLSIYGFISCLFLPFSVLVIRQLFPCIQTPTLPVSPRSISLLIHSKYQNSGRVCPLGHFDEILNSAFQRERESEGGMGWIESGLRARGAKKIHPSTRDTFQRTTANPHMQPEEQSTCFSERMCIDAHKHTIFTFTQNLFPPAVKLNSSSTLSCTPPTACLKKGSALCAGDTSFCLVSVATACSLQTDIMGHRHFRLTRAKNTALSPNRTQLING